MMKIGQYDVYSVITSKFSLDGGAMFGIVPKSIWEKKNPSDEFNRIEMVTRSLLLVSETRKILIDTGNGTKWDEKSKNIYGINTDSQSIDLGLKKYGFSANDITDVICTHLHFDHVGGNTKKEEGKIIPTFVNAKYWITKGNWKLANNPSKKDSGSFMIQDWKVLEENAMLRIINGEKQFIDGIEFRLTNGHTNDLLHPIISDTSNTIFFGSDIFPLTSHISIPWIMSYDLNPLKTIHEKEELLMKMYNEEWILFFGHDPFVQACTLRHEGKHYKVNQKVIISE